MSVLNYSIIGVAACVAAVGGAYLNMNMQVSAAREAAGIETKEEAEPTGRLKTPQIPIPIYSANERLGYCVVRAIFVRDEPSQDERVVAVPEITNKLFVEFAKDIDPEIDGETACSDKVGTTFETFKVVEGEFYEKFR